MDLEMATTTFVNFSTDFIDETWFIPLNPHMPILPEESHDGLTKIFQPFKLISFEVTL